MLTMFSHCADLILWQELFARGRSRIREIHTGSSDALLSGRHLQGCVCGLHAQREVHTGSVMRLNPANISRMCLHSGKDFFLEQFGEAAPNPFLVGEAV
jgi:hypothetical protein